MEGGSVSLWITRTGGGGHREEKASVVGVGYFFDGCSEIGGGCIREEKRGGSAGRYSGTIADSMK